jgi:hypothetical protein
MHWSKVKYTPNVNQLMTKQIAVYPDNGKLFGNKQEQGLDNLLEDE